MDPGPWSHWTWIVVAGALASFVMAFGIGANDVANAFGSSVGARTLSLRQALAIAAVCEFTGSVLLGGEVTRSVAGGIARLTAFEQEPELYMFGMLCALVAAGFWLLLATYWSLPVSTTHSIIGAVLGFAFVYGGPSAVVWLEPTNTFPYMKGMVPIVVSWLVSPLISGLAAVLLFWAVRGLILRREDSLQRTFWAFPVILLVTVFVNVYFVLDKGASKRLFWPRAKCAWVAAAAAGGAAVVAVLLRLRALRRLVGACGHGLVRSCSVDEAGLAPDGGEAKRSPQPGSCAPASPLVDSSRPSRYASQELQAVVSARALATTTISLSSQQTAGPSICAGDPRDMSAHGFGARSSNSALRSSASAISGQRRQGSATLGLENKHSTELMRQQASGVSGMSGLEPDRSLRHQGASAGPDMLGAQRGPTAGPYQQLQYASSLPALLQPPVPALAAYAPWPPLDQYQEQQPQQLPSPHAQQQGSLWGAGQPPTGLACGHQQELPPPPQLASPEGAQPGPLAWTGAELRRSGHWAAGPRPFWAQERHQLDDASEVVEVQSFGPGPVAEAYGGGPLQPVYEQPYGMHGHDPYAYGAAPSLAMYGNGVGLQHGGGTCGAGAFGGAAYGGDVHYAYGEAAVRAEVYSDGGGASDVDMYGRPMSYGRGMFDRESEPAGRRALPGAVQHTFDALKAIVLHGASVPVHAAVDRDSAARRIHHHAEVFDPATENAFKPLQILTAICDSISHGANDVANAAGPFAAIYYIYSHKRIDYEVDLPIWILALGGAGIVVGLATYGYNIIQAIGVRLSVITPSRGFCIELATSIVVLLASKVGLPISTTHCQVGSTAGMGLMEGTAGLNWRLLLHFFTGWVVTLALTGLLSATLFALFAFAPCVQQGRSIRALEGDLAALTIRLTQLIARANAAAARDPATWGTASAALSASTQARLLELQRLSQPGRKGATRPVQVIEPGEMIDYVDTAVQLYINNSLPYIGGMAAQGIALPRAP